MIHKTLSRYASECKDSMKGSDIVGIESELDVLAAKIWGITDDELKAIQQARADL